jgi:hypothetical protein
MLIKPRQSFMHRRRSRDIAIREYIKIESTQAEIDEALLGEEKDTEQDETFIPYPYRKKVDNTPENDSWNFLFCRCVMRMGYSACT